METEEEKNKNSLWLQVVQNFRNGNSLEFEWNWHTFGFGFECVFGETFWGGSNIQLNFGWINLSIDIYPANSGANEKW